MNVERIICDSCHDAEAVCIIGDEELCEDCAEDRFHDLFTGKDLHEKAELLNEDFNYLNE